MARRNNWGTMATVLFLALAAAAAVFVATRVASERQRLTANPLELRREHDVRNAALLFLKDASSSSKTAMQSMATLQAIMTKLRDDWDDLAIDGDYPDIRSASKEVLGGLYWSVAEKITSTGCVNQYELITLLDSTKPTTPSDTLWGGYNYALKYHNLSTINR